jgi:hypothetical protein
MGLEMSHDFRQDEPWRIFRIMAEFVEGTEEMARIRPAASVFGSARTMPGTEHYQMGEDLGRMLAERGINVITGGGPGIMEAANKGAKESGHGIGVGLNIELPYEQVPNPYVEKLLSFRYFFVRKVMFVKYSCAVIVLPGGYGTLDEFFEAITLVQTEKAPSVPVFLMGRTYWEGLLQWLEETMLASGAICPEDLDLFHVSDDPEEVADAVLEASKTHETGTPTRPAPGGGM